MQPIRSFPLALLGALVLLSAGCDAEPEVEDLPAAEGVDTMNESAMDGLSREQILEGAEAISPEEAEARGIIDSTIHIPDPTISDTLFFPPRAGPAPPGSRPR